jgi:hypothetical protein
VESYESVDSLLQVQTRRSLLKEVEPGNLRITNWKDWIRHVQKFCSERELKALPTIAPSRSVVQNAGDIAECCRLLQGSVQGTKICAVKRRAQLSNIHGPVKAVFLW